MRTYIYLFISLLVCNALSFANFPLAGSWLYRETFKETTITKQISIILDDTGGVISISDAIFKGELFFDATGAVSRATVQGEDNLRITATLKGRDVFIEGMTPEGKFAKTVTLTSNNPWIGSYQLLAPFVLNSKSKEMIFHLVVLEAQFSMQLKAIKESRETIDWNGQNVDVQKVRITLPDWRGFMWSSYVWYRLSDGLIIKSDELRGPPTTPYTEVRLVKLL